MNLFTCLFTLTYFQNWQILGMFKLSGVCYSLVSPLNASFFLSTLKESQFLVAFCSEFPHV